MIQIDDKIIALDVIDEHFICDLAACLGTCCVEGDSGAPLETEEVRILEDLLPTVWDDLSPKAKDIIKKQGVAYEDTDGEVVTSIVNNKDCVFTYYDEKNICKCAIEKAYKEGKTNFYKPISCHLYPIRLQQYHDFTAINYHRWQICKHAVTLGKKEGVAIYQFLKDPLIRKFGEVWYNELCSAVKEYKNMKKG